MINFLSAALPTYAVMIIIAVIVVQYAFALFCLLKLAYLDISKKEYALWNVFILIVFFIGGIVFLVYWSKVKDVKRIPPIPETQEKSEDGEVQPEAAKPEDNIDEQNADAPQETEQGEDKE